MSAADAAEVDEVVSSVWHGQAKKNMPGFWVGVWDPAKGVYLKAHGVAGPQHPATDADYFRIGSISKTFTAVVILQLVADGRLALADTVADVDPELARKYPDTAKVTVKELLDMHSGIPDYGNSKRGITSQVAADPQKVWTADQLIAAGFAAGKAQPRGTAGYSTTNFIILQEIAEKLGGAPLAEQIRTGVTEPLGLSDTFLPPDDDTNLPDPRSYSFMTESCQKDLKGIGGSIPLGTNMTDWNASYGQGGGGMTSALTDMGRWAASMSGNELLPDDLAKQRLEFSDIGGTEYGLGISKAGEWIGHEGETYGWEAISVHNPSNGVSIALATNSCGVATVLKTLIYQLYPDSPPFLTQ